MSERTDAERLPLERHIHPDDKRYDGFRIREYWIATAIAPDNQEAPLWVDPVAAAAFHMVVGPAMASDERRLLHLREFADWTAKKHGIEVRVRHFVPERDSEAIFDG